MPTVFMLYGFRFYFYSNEESRMHIHIQQHHRRAKIWLDTLEFASNNGFPEHDLFKIKRLVRKNEEKFKKAWKAHFG